MLLMLQGRRCFSMSEITASLKLRSTDSDTWCVKQPGSRQRECCHHRSASQCSFLEAFRTPAKPSNHMERTLDGAQQAVPGGSAGGRTAPYIQLADIKVSLRPPVPSSLTPDRAAATPGRTAAAAISGVHHSTNRYISNVSPRPPSHLRAHQEHTIWASKRQSGIAFTDV
jgi:hypothetical protein